MSTDSDLTNCTISACLLIRLQQLIVHSVIALNAVFGDPRRSYAEELPDKGRWISCWDTGFPSTRIMSSGKGTSYTFGTELLEGRQGTTSSVLLLPCQIMIDVDTVRTMFEPKTAHQKPSFCSWVSSNVNQPGFGLQGLPDSSHCNGSWVHFGHQPAHKSVVQYLFHCCC